VTDYCKQLAIFYTTYNRPEIITDNISRLIPQLTKYSISVYIFDDSNNNETEIAIRKLQEVCHFINYFHNKPSLGHDTNFFNIYSIHDVNYVWYLGDSIYIKDGVIDQIFKIINKSSIEYDFIFVNYNHKDTLNTSVSVCSEFILDKIWFLTLSGATLYGINSRKLIVSDNIKSKWRNYPQLGLILKSFTSGFTHCYWFGTQGIDLHPLKRRSYWTGDVINVFVNDWTWIINSFSSLVNAKDFKQLLKSHAMNSGIFKWNRLILYRSHCGISFNQILKNWRNFIRASNTIFIPIFISLIPIRIAKIIHYILIRLLKFYKSI
jgi:hypothetical protein